MKTYIALIVNNNSKLTRIIDVCSFSINGLRERIELTFLKKDEVLMSLYPKQHLELQ